MPYGKILALAVVGLLSAASSPAVPCEDQARVYRELIARYIAERARAEVEVATEMAQLKRVIEQLANERDAARAKLSEQGK